MRTKNSLKNSIVSVCGYGLVFLFGLALRKVFILNLDFDNLGYEGLFTNIFNVLIVADLGAGSLVVYRLYAAFAAEDRENVARLVAMNRRLNLLMTGVIVMLGVCVLPLLPLLIRDSVADWGYVRLIYLLQLLSTTTPFLFSYCNALLNADQKDYETMRIWTVMRLVTQIVKSVSILLFQNYIVYLLLGILCGLLTGGVTYLRCKKLYPDAMRGKCVWSDFRSTGLTSELSGVGVVRILNAVYYATDSVLISIILGVRSVALYGNYTVISINVNGMFENLLQPLAGSVGNFVNTETHEDSFRLFRAIDLISFFCASFAMTSYGVLFQPLIGLLFGTDFLLSNGFVFLFSLSHYLYIKRLGLHSFRKTFGSYREEWGFVATSSVFNIVLSIVGCRLWGITGIVFGTVVSQVVVWLGDSILCFRHCFYQPGARYMLRQALRVLLACGELLLATALTAKLPATAGGFVLRALVCLLLPNALNLLIYFRTEAFSRVRRYLGDALALLKERMQKKDAAE